MQPLIHEIDGDEYKIEVEGTEVTIIKNSNVVHNFYNKDTFSEFMEMMMTAEHFNVSVIGMKCWKTLLPLINI